MRGLLTSSKRYGAAGICLMLLVPLMVQAQPSGSLADVYEGADLNQRQGDSIPLTLTFQNAAGESVPLGTYFNQGRPVILTLGYFECPQLCNIILKGLTDALKEMDWKPGVEFDIVSVSIAANETPADAEAMKRQYLQALGVPEAEAGWHFLTSDEEAPIQALAESIGFEYEWVDEIEQYVHPAVLTFLTEAGSVSQYMQGVRFNPQDVRYSLIEASNGTIGNAFDMIALYCLVYDPNANSYVVQAANVMKLGGAVTVVILGLTMFFFWRRESSSSNSLAST